MNNVVNNNKHHMTICYQIYQNAGNPNPTTLKLYGCQFIAMSFQNMILI